MGTHLSIGDLARLLALPQWRVRRAVDRLARKAKAIPRIGRYRIVPRELRGDLVADLEQRGAVLQEVAG